MSSQGVSVCEQGTRGVVVFASIPFLWGKLVFVSRGQERWQSSQEQGVPNGDVCRQDLVMELDPS